MSQHAARIARDHCLAPERVDAPIYGGRYRSLFEDLPSLQVDEEALHQPNVGRLHQAAQPAG
jgi:hypothetical protein